ncbi:uncharacterized protein BXZ73DRAFT_102856 [Epithele typhae]|uniref:uncharacterized protein n=1 Tax=Epithele typhae TaxID=378194 RepID=UPI002007B416|nr:uncharacterized protein BXZ73DRAFT_102856 [Epithele typhae]KAH9926596.1 hypothetical protein BXZ73DRAFT_102856 [Epithele typhae]
MDALEDELGRQARVQSYSESLVFEPGQVVDLTLAKPDLTNRPVQRPNTLLRMIEGRASTDSLSSFSFSTPHDLGSTLSNGNAYYPLSFHARREQHMAEPGLFHDTDASAMAFGFVRHGEKVSDAETEPVGRVLGQRLVQLPWPSDRMDVELLANLVSSVGTIIASASDMTKWFAMHANGGVDPENGQVVIPASIFKRLATMYSIENGEPTKTQGSFAG